MTRAWRRAKRLLKTAIWFAVIFGIGFYAINGVAFWQRVTFSTQGLPSVEEPLILPVPTVNYQSELIIPKIGVQAPVIYDASFDAIIERLRDGVVRYEGTADPGQVGNVVIVGHSSDYPWSSGRYKTIFALLDKLTVNDEIILPYGINRFVYKVTTIKTVKPSDLTVLNKTSTPTLTLITCYPVGTVINRLVVSATLTEGPIGPTQTTEPFLGDKLTTAR